VRPAPYYRDDRITLHTGDAAEVLARLPEASVHCVVTSPPYWNRRDYRTGHWVNGDPTCQHVALANHDGTIAQNLTEPASAAYLGRHPHRCRRCSAWWDDRQHGREPTPQDYVDRLRGVFAQLRRVLIDTGTVWLNLGDSYSAEPPRRPRDTRRPSTPPGTTARGPGTQTIPRKNVIGMPWRVALALQGDGWILRNAIVWHKPNAMPESVKDRLSTRYEMLFLLTKQQRYYFNLDPLREPLARPEALGDSIVISGSTKGRHAGTDATARRHGNTISGKYTATDPFPGQPPGAAMRPTGMRHNAGHPNGKNPGDVWSIPTRPLRQAHFAAYPIDIPLRCIAAGCPPDGVVLDPFSGAATTGLAARQLGRSYIGIDLNPEFHAIGLRRLGLHPSTTDHSRRAA
jgi:DNA modification methylase